MEWLGQVTGIKVGDILELKTGVALCELMNKLFPGKIKTALRPKHKLEYDVQF